MEEDIVRLHVAVHDVVLVKHLEGLQQLFQNEHGLLLGKFDLFGQQILQGPSVAVLVNEVEVVAGLQHVKVANYVRVMLDIG